MQQREPTRLDQPYSAFRRDEMILRDYLAADRTVLANERTLLSYIRTALASAAGGVSLIHFLEGALLDATGVLLIVTGGAALVIGAMRYRQVRKRLSVLDEPPSDQTVRAMLQARKDEDI